MILSDIVAGLFVVQTNGAVVGRLARLAANGTTGKPEAVPPGDTVPFGPYYQVVDANSANASLLPLDPFNMTRLPLSGTCAIGDALFVRADGKVEKKAAPADGNVSVAFAVEAGVDGQEVLCRPHLMKWVVPAGA